MTDDKNKNDKQYGPTEECCDDPEVPSIPAPFSEHASHGGQEHRPSHHYVTRALDAIKSKWPSATTWTTLATVVMAVATAIYAFYAGRQWKAINDQLPELQKAASAADTNATIAKNSFEMERRRAEDQEEATCRLQTYGTAVSVNFDQATVINDGKVKARNITAHLDASLYDIVDTDKKIRDIGSVDLSAGELAGNSQSLTQQFNLALSAHDWQNLADTNQMIVYKGHVGYENGFGRLVEQPYCMAWYFFRSATDQNNPIQGRGTPCSNLPAQMNEVRREKANLKH
jgi:hypothetical protein